MMNTGIPMPQRPPAQGMDTGMNPEMLMRLMQQQNQQGPQTTPINQPVRDPNSFAKPNPNVGTTSSWIPPAPQFDQAAQPGLAGIAPRNIPQATVDPVQSVSSTSQGPQPPLSAAHMSTGLSAPGAMPMPKLPPSQELTRGTMGMGGPPAEGRSPLMSAYTNKRALAQ